MKDAKAEVPPPGDRGLPHRGYLTTVFGNYCPRCREGKIFKYGMSLRLSKNMAMEEKCPVCGQPTEIEVGFYYGTSYVSYVLAIILCVISFLLWYLFIGFSFSDNRFMYWMICNVIFLILVQIPLMRFSRTLWLSWFVRYDPDWKVHRVENYERIVKDHMNNW